MSSTSNSVRFVRERVLAEAKDLPAAPHVFARLMALLQQPDMDLAEVADVVACDAALAGKVLATANSVYFRGEVGVATVIDAVARLGAVEVHRVIGRNVAARLFCEGLPLYGVSGEAMWSNAIAGALAMEALARHADLDVNQAYTLGLLRQVGKLALARVALREHWEVTCPPDVDNLGWEQVRFEIHNHEAAADILAQWSLPLHFSSALRGCLDVASAADPRWAGALHLTGWVVEQLHLGVPVEKTLWRVSPGLCDQVGVPERLLPSVIDETGNEWKAIHAMMQEGA